MIARVGIELTSTRIAREYESLRGALAEPIVLEGFDRTLYAPEAIESAIRFWRQRMEAEHRSVQVFAQIALHLIEANAPHDAKTVMLRMAQDELLHTEICGRVLQALGDDARVDIDVAVAPIATHAGCTLEERALRNVVYATCLSEMIAVGRLVDSLETTRDPGVRSAIRAVLRDEVMHGQFGFLYLDALAPVLDAKPSIKDDLATYLTHAFGVLERELASPRLQSLPSPHPDALSLGVIDPRRAHDVFYGTIEAAIVPGLEARGIAAAKAWRTRAA